MSFRRFVVSIKCRFDVLSFRLNVVLTFCRILHFVVSAFCRFEVMSLRGYVVRCFVVRCFVVRGFVVRCFVVVSTRGLSMVEPWFDQRFVSGWVLVWPEVCQWLSPGLTRGLSVVKPWFDQRFVSGWALVWPEICQWLGPGFTRRLSGVKNTKEFTTEKAI